MDNIEEIQTKLQETKQTVENLNTQIEFLEEQLKQLKIKSGVFKRANKKEHYYMIVRNYEFGSFAVTYETENYGCYNNNHFESGNYFLTRERAKEVADKMNFLLRLERLHNELCPDYKPNKNKKEERYYIIFNARINKYICEYNFDYYSDIGVYFPNSKISQKACDILNNELENNK